MRTLTIRNLEPGIKDKLRFAAAAHGRSHARPVCSTGGVELELPARADQAKAADFGV